MTVTVTMHACTDKPYLIHCHRNVCILIGLFVCDNSCVHGQLIPPSLSWKLLHFDWLISFEIVIARNYKVIPLLLTNQNQVFFYVYDCKTLLLFHKVPCTRAIFVSIFICSSRWTKLTNFCLTIIFAEKLAC